MCLKFASLALVCLSGLAAQRIPLVKDKRQVGASSPSALDTDTDREPAESGFVGLTQPAAHQAAGSKYFQYIHVPAKDHYEHGHKQGNEHHFIERHEKGHPHAGEFKNKVRWGDKHGGYGEHYWDYNHAGHGGHDHESDSEESQHSEAFEEYPEESKHAPTYEASSRGKRNPEDDVEFIDNKARSLILDARAPKHGGNYRRAKEVRDKREPAKLNSAGLVFDEASTRVVPIYEASSRGKRNPDDDVEFINDKARSLILGAKVSRHGGNYRRKKDARAKREPSKLNSDTLVFDEASGMIVDTTTGVF